MSHVPTFCPNIECPARGKRNRGNIGRHSIKENRYRCKVCGQTFSGRKATIYYRLKTEPEIVTLVVTLIALGCPIQAIVQAFELDERTVCSWWQKAGEYCEGIHHNLVESQQLDLQQVQADEIKVKVQGGSIWMAMAMMVSSRLWLGGVVSPHRDKALIQALADKVRAMALCRPLLLAVDGLSSYVTAFRAAFRTKLPRQGKLGRCQLRSWSELTIVQVVKHRSSGTLSITRRIVQGCQQQIDKLIVLSQGQGQINTAFIERLNATWRQRLNPLARRTRSLARRPETLKHGMFVVGCLYNFCTYHRSLRLPLWMPNNSHRWLHRTPAIAAGLTDHRWSVEEFLWFGLAPDPWTPPKQRGRRSKQMQALIHTWAS